jgi:hypothetical protein
MRLYVDRFCAFIEERSKKLQALTSTVAIPFSLPDINAPHLSIFGHPPSSFFPFYFDGFCVESGRP